MDPQVFIETDIDQLLPLVTDYHSRGWRFVNICGSSVEGKVELLYSFSSGEELENLRLLVSNDQSVPAVSGLYPNSFFFENETHDLFGVDFKGISLDFGGAFYPTSVPTPMNPASAAARAQFAPAPSHEESDPAQTENIEREHLEKDVPCSTDGGQKDLAEDDRG
ncbi:MAG: NADH-quinone oxidoreductase subunit C [Coriobacteriales bacterium]|jgi:ech hydrogenase subunit D|nr:NADH-quinone oxidoreductase subunit C [Coriobacteriales bacterium]